MGEDIVISGTEDNQIRPSAANKDMTYYAKYDYRRGDLNISVTGDDVTTVGQPFEFTVKGTDSHNNWIELIVCIKPDTKQSVTIKDLPIGNYTVTKNSWSWRYQTPEQLKKTVNEGETVTATFSEVISNKKWFDGNAYCNNRFT